MLTDPRAVHIANAEPNRWPDLERTPPPLKWSARRSLLFIVALAALLWVGIYMGGAWLWRAVG